MATRFGRRALALGTSAGAVGTFYTALDGKNLTIFFREIVLESFFTHALRGFVVRQLTALAHFTHWNQVF